MNLRSKFAILGLVLAVFILIPALPAGALVQSNVCQNSTDFYEVSPGSGVYLPCFFYTGAGPASTHYALDLILAIIELALYVVGFLAVLFIVVGGYRYLTAHGNEELAEAAKKTLKNAIIGLIVVILAFVIVRVIVNALTTAPPSGGAPPPPPPTPICEEIVISTSGSLTWPAGQPVQIVFDADPPADPVGSYTWAMVDGTLPEALRFDASGASITGVIVPLAAQGNYPFTLQVTAVGCSGYQAFFTLTVTAP